MKYRVKVTESATADIADIIDYISHNLLAPQSARAWMKKLQREMATLDEMPKRYPLVEDEPWHSEGIRKFLVGNFIVYYWVSEETQIVWVTLVVYARRDQLTALRNMP